MVTEEQKNRMTEGSIAGKLVHFAVPMFIGNLFQQLYNTADALIVGNMLGSDALAAVSSVGTMIFLLISLFEGVAMGAGVAVSYFFGAKDYGSMRRTIHTNIAFSLVTSLGLTACGITLAPAILRLMGTPDEILPMAVRYTRIYFAGSVGMVMYNALRGIMQAVGDSRHPLIYLIITSVSNVILDIVFIAFFNGGVGSAALATIIAQLISAILCFARLMRSNEEYRVRLREIGFDGSMLRLIVKYGLPTGLQNSAIAISNVIVQANINAFGTAAIAGCGAYSKIEGFAFLPITSFMLALTTFIGQNLGAEEYDRAKKGAYFGICSAVILAEIIGIAVSLSAPRLILAFTDDAEAIAYGIMKARTCAPFFFLLAISHGVAGVMRGAGKAAVPMAVMLICWCGVRVFILTVFSSYIKSIAIVNWVYPITWCLSSIVFAIYFFRSDWLHGFKRGAESLPSGSE